MNIMAPCIIHNKANLSVFQCHSFNKNFDMVDDPHLFSNQFETKTSTDTMHSLTWKQKELRDSRFKNPRHQSFMNRDPSGKAGEDTNVIHRICCPSAFFSPMLLVIITLTLQFLEEKNSDIIKGDRDNNEGVLLYENRFQTFR